MSKTAAFVSMTREASSISPSASIISILSLSILAVLIGGSTVRVPRSPSDVCGMIE